MQIKTIGIGQSIFDLSVLLTGSIKNCVDLFKKNPGIGDFDNITPGAVVTSDNYNNEVTRYYQLNEVAPATAHVSPDPLVLGEMIIDINFTIL